jgi:hypothetical protein
MIQMIEAHWERNLVAVGVVASDNCRERTQSTVDSPGDVRRFWSVSPGSKTTDVPLDQQIVGSVMGEETGVRRRCHS